MVCCGGCGKSLARTKGDDLIIRREFTAVGMMLQFSKRNRDAAANKDGHGQRFGYWVFPLESETNMRIRCDRCGVVNEIDTEALRAA